MNNKENSKARREEMEFTALESNDKPLLDREVIETFLSAVHDREEARIIAGKLIDSFGIGGVLGQEIRWLENYRRDNWLYSSSIKNWNNSEFHRISTLGFDLGLEPITFGRLDRFSLYEVGKVQDLMEKASENYKNKSKYAPKVENDFKCLVSINNFIMENKNPIYQRLSFSSLQDHVSFTENYCSLEQIEELKNKTPSSNQILTLLEKLENNLLLNDYDSNIIDQCNKWMISLGLGVLKPLVITAVYEGK